VELIQRPHPFGVTFREVVVNRDYMDAFPCQGVKEHGQSGHEGLALAGSHLGNLPFMQRHPADELDIIVDHVPYYLIASCHPAVFPVCLLSLHGY